MLVSPMSNATIIIGHVAGGVIRGLLVGVMVTGIALAFTRLEIANPLITFSMVLLSSIVFALAGFINAVFAKKFDDISIVPTVVLTPLTRVIGIRLAEQTKQNIDRGADDTEMQKRFFGDTHQLRAH